MKTLLTRSVKNVAAVFAAALITIPAFAQTTSPAPQTKAPGLVPNAAKPPAAASLSAATTPVEANKTAQPSDAEMMAKMMELSKLNDNHKLLGSLVGTWTNTVKMWMNPDPKAPPSESKGTATRKAIMGGRYFTSDFTGQMQMPGADGKMKNMEFKGMSIEGYDNAKQKFVSTWCDNMGTGIMMSEGTYDAATKTFTYTAEYEPLPGMKTKARETLKIVDANHHTFEYYEDHGAGEMKSMEINYTRKK